ncbi:hypothetical protein P879_05380 [Paragonimus westermani]|uniref:C3H1-type domain-containing protein n=1 Tax=Paragonimus westermani TaxID=34504 RepID=A0A8T0D1V8_9TREM|nr:hypothetical protein P879_05380 [Paragonimus westermani]
MLFYFPSFRRSERIFCHDFQNSVCRRPACKFLHYSREDEEIFRLTGHLPDEVDSKGDGSQATAIEESPPICKDYLNGICTRGPSCKYRHMSLANEKRTQCCSVTDAPSTFHDLFLDEVCAPDFVPVMCTAPPSQPILSTSLAVALQHPTMLTVPTTVPNHDRIQLTQSATLNTSIVSGQESVLTPVKDMYINSGAPPAPVVGVVDHVGLPSSNLQHTIYAHPSGLGTFTPLVSVSSSSQPVPCSSVLAVVAEPSQHPTLLQHPTAVAASQTTYHLLSSTPASMQQQLLSSSSSVSSAPALLTIPLPQFACNSTTPGAILASHASAECNAHQHPSVLANRALANASGTCFPSYNLLHINPTSAVETVPVFPGQHALPDKVTTAVSSSTTAVLAAAAAAGYLAQHLPVMTGGTPVTPSDSGGGCSGNGPATLNVRFGSQQDLMVDRTPESAALAAAANLPAVSAAAAAAVAAAKVFAARTTGMPLSDTSYSAENSKCLPNLRDLNGSQRASKSEQSKTPANTDCSGDALFIKKQTSLHFPSCYPTSTATSTTTTSIASEVHVSTTSPPINTTPASSSSSHYVHRTQQDEEDAKTAAAVAAAACIGAMFSQPLSGGGADSSSVAAMLGDLMGKNHLNLGHSTITQEGPEVSRTSQFSSADASFQSTYVSLEEQFPCESSLTTSHLNNLRKDVSLAGDVTNLQNSTDSSITLCSEDNSGSLSGFQCHSFSNPRMDFANSSTWTSVATTVASAAQAAAAAAVAVTAAVTRSAKFFQLTRNQGAQQSFTPESELPRGRDSEHSHFADMDPQVREPSNTKSLVTATEPDRTTLSPNTAVTMTSAAAAAAMVAAAASAAAKQRRMFSGRRLQTYPDCIDLPYSSQPRLNLPPKDAYDAEDSEYSVACDTDRYTPPKRRMKIRAVTSKRYGYVRLRRDVAIREPLEDDEDEEEPDVYEDDITLSPEVTPPYGVPVKQKRHSGQLSIMYNQNTDDSRPASCDTSPSETLETEPYSISRRSEAISIPCSSATFHSGECVHDLAVPGSRSRIVVPRDLFPFDQKDVVCSTSVQTSASAISRTQKPLSSVNIVHPVASVSSVVTCPTPRHASFPRRSRSVSSPSTFCHKIATPLRSKSLPPLPCIHNSSVGLHTEDTQPESAIQCDIPKSPAPSALGVQQCPYGSASQVTSTRSASVERVPFKGSSESYRKRYRRPVPLLLSSSRRMLKLRHSKEMSMLARGTNKIDSLVSKRRNQDRTPTTASPDSVLNEDYSGHDDADDPEYVDTEDYDDDLFDLRASETSIKRSRSLRATCSKPGKRKVNDLFASGGFSNFTYSSVSMRHQNALKAENVRLRRKLSDLMRQRGDLRAANEILLEQNARLRHSSKRVSAVARMAASATKIIEAHNKSQFAQPVSHALSAPVFPPSSIHVTQSGNPFSLTQAAAAVVAAAQQQSNTPALHGVYVSSPTASITQAAPQAVAALTGGAHALFPSAVMAGAIPGTITLSSHQPLTTVQIQGSVDSLVPTSISTQSPAMIGQQSLASQQNTVRNFYHSQLHSVGSLPVSIANLTPHPNLATAPSTIQVCHYPIPSSAAVFPTLPHSTAVSPSMMPMGTPNAVTLLVGPQPPPTAYTSVGSHPRLPSTLHLQGNLETKHASINVSPVSQFPSYVYQGSPSSGMLTTNNTTHLTNSIQNMDCFSPSTSKSSIPQHTARRRMKKL